MWKWKGDNLNVHIALIGKTKEPVLKGFQFYAVDKLYLLHSPDSRDFAFQKTAEGVRKRLATVGFRKVILMQINPFDMHSIIQSIVQIMEQEKQASIHINITGGTNLMAGAACSAAFFIGARTYYVLDENKLPTGSTLKDQILELPIPSIPYVRCLQGNQLKILKRLLEHGGTTSNTRLRFELKISPQKLSYHLKQLEAKGFVTTNRGCEETLQKAGKSKIDRRRLSVLLTNSGKLVASWTDI